MTETRVICPACGCRLLASAADPAGRVVCPDCGKRTTLHPPPEAADGPLESTDELAAAAVATTTPVARPTQAKRRWPAVVVLPVAAATVAAVVTAVLVARPSSPTPVALATTERSDGDGRFDLHAIKDAADAALLRGDLRAAYDGYGRVLALSAEHGVADPALAGVRDAQDQVFAAMTAAVPAAAPPAVVEPPHRAAVAVGPPTGDQFLDRFSDGPGTVNAQPAAPRPPSPATSPADPTDVALAKVDDAPAVGVPPPPPSLHAHTLPDAVGDEQIGRAITAAIGYLRQHGPPASVAPPPLPVAPPPAAAGHGPEPFDASGGSALDGTAAADATKLPPAPKPPAPPPKAYAAGFGNNADGPYLLAVYALLHAAQASDQKGLGGHDPAVRQVLEQIKLFYLTGTYSRSLRAAALAVYDRPEDRAALEEDVAWLIAAQRGGAYTYTMPPFAPRRSSMGLVVDDAVYDNSNSQYGLLGVWSGAQAGIAVPADYWRAVQAHWVRDAAGNGTWGYTGGTGGYLSMTFAGVASLLVTRDYLDALATPGDLRTTRLPQLAAGLAYLDAGDNCMDDHGNAGLGFASYALYGLERVGLASGYKYFGDHDWYAELAKLMVDGQRPDGGWNTDAISTSYDLLFLARGRHPILFNKLRYPGDWENRPTDVSHLARFASKQLERPLNWQVVNLRRDWFDWMDAPVLYISGDAAPSLTPHDYDALRDYALGGGLIFTHADNGSPAFNAWAKGLARRCFPRYELTPVPKGHPLDTVVYHLKTPPPLEAVTNGSRVLMLHGPADLAGGWQLNWTADRRAAFEAGVNVFAYAAGKRGLNNRLASPYVPLSPTPPKSARTVARLRYAGEWDPEPYAWTRFARLFQWETGGGLAAQPVDLKALTPRSYPAAFLTGTVRQDFTPAEAAAARAYVTAGGVLVIDACGGQSAFDKSVRESLVPVAFPEATLAPLSSTHPALVPSRPGADDLRQPMPTRPYVMEATGTNKSPVEGFRFGRGWVIYSRLDLTTGLLGTNTFGVLGYEPAYAEALVKNVVLWADARAAALAAK